MRVVALVDYRPNKRSAAKPSLFFDPIARKKLNPILQQESCRIPRDNRIHWGVAAFWLGYLVFLIGGAFSLGWWLS